MAQAPVHVEGILLVDKPAGITSHDVVARVRSAARSKRVGHAGTLDPFATGLLVIAVGGYTRLLPYMLGEPKVYDAVIRFGAETDTDDATGTVTVQAPAANLHDGIALQHALASLTGALDQIPPSYSAKHVHGQRAYALARRGDDVVLPPSRVQVHDWAVQSLDGVDLHVRVTCGGGTYVRALARDLGRALNSAAHCHTLRRVASGPSDVKSAVSMDCLERGSIASGAVLLQSPLPMLANVTHVNLSDDDARALSFGRAVQATQSGGHAALLYQNRVVAIATRTSDDRWQPRLVLLGDAVIPPPVQPSGAFPVESAQRDASPSTGR